jgi:glycine cleavage system transcriptional repressor
MNRRILTFTGPDGPGLIAAISCILAEQGADIEDVSMTRLSGNFALMMLERGGDEARIRPRLEEVARTFSLRCHIEPAVEECEHEEANGFISAIGPNRVGIVAAISRVLALCGANVIEMTTRLLEKTEVPVYMVRIETAVPGEWTQLEENLTKAGSELGIEVRLERIEHEDL